MQKMRKDRPWTNRAGPQRGDPGAQIAIEFRVCGQKGYIAAKCALRGKVRCRDVEKTCWSKRPVVRRGRGKVNWYEKNLNWYRFGGNGVDVGGGRILY